MRRANIVLAVTLALVLCFTAPSFASGSPAAGLDTFVEVLENVHGYHLNKPDQGVLLQGAIDGLINSLDDPYSEYLPPRELEEFNRALDGEYTGVGIQLEPGEHYPTVIGTIKGSPAAEAGVRPRDRIIKVDGTDTFDLLLSGIVQKIRGPEGAKVRLTIRREGTGDFELELVRAGINNPTVSRRVLADGSGYIQIHSFGKNTSNEFNKALAELRQQGALGLILDLRDNPGGLLETAVQIAGAFIEPGQVVVSTLDHSGAREVYRTKGTPAGAGMRVMVLVNQYSASASEILAGALQDHHAATVIGSQTFGKGTVQVVTPLNTGGALKLTVSKYLTPRDREINGAGLSPDCQVITPALQVIAARRLLTPPGQNEVILELEKTDALVDGEPVQIKQSVLKYNGTIYLPLRFTFEALGFRVDWQPADLSVKVSGYGSDAVYCAGPGGCNQATPLLIIEGETFIPLNELGNFGINARIDGEKIFINI